MMPARPQLRPPNQADDAFAKLERMIVTLELAPGREMTERALIDLMLMGRTPVREAIQRLSHMGLIEIRPRKGIMIARIDPEDILRIMDIRRRLEPIFARKAVESATDAQRAEVERCRIVMQESARRNDMKLFLTADKMFDMLLAQAAQDIYLFKALEPLQTHSRRLWFKYLARYGLAVPARLHMTVMQDFIANNPTGAEVGMRALADMMIEAYAVRLAEGARPGENSEQAILADPAS